MNCNYEMYLNGFHLCGCVCMYVHYPIYFIFTYEAIGV